MALLDEAGRAATLSRIQEIYETASSPAEANAQIVREANAAFGENAAAAIAEVTDFNEAELRTMARGAGEEFAGTYTPPVDAGLDAGLDAGVDAGVYQPVDYSSMFPSLDFSNIQLTGDPEQDYKIITAAAMEKSLELAGRPYQPFPDERVLGFTPEEEAGREQMRTLALSGLGYPQAERAAEVAASVAGYTPSLLRDVDLTPYQTQYQEGVTDIALRELDRQRQLRQQDVAAQAERAGAFGGTRQGIVESELERQYAQQAGDIATRGAQAGLEYAQRGALADLTAQRAAPGVQLQGASALSQAANQLRSLGYSDAEVIQQLGGQERALSQLGRDFDYSQFQEAQAFPSQQLSYMLAPISGGFASSFAPQYIDQPSFLQNVAGTVGAVGSLYGGLTGNPLIGGEGSLFGSQGSFFGNPFGS